MIVIGSFDFQSNISPLWADLKAVKKIIRISVFSHVLCNKYHVWEMYVVA